MQPQKILFLETPAGPMGLCGNGRAVTRLFFALDIERNTPVTVGLQPGDLQPDGCLPLGALASGCPGDPVLDLACRELASYFRGETVAFTVPLELEGSSFERSVWNEILKIPTGTTRSYGEIASSLGKKGAARAVGGAAHRNPVAIVVPCHRVIGSDGKLTGYAGGIGIKRMLLGLEGQKEFGW